MADVPTLNFRFVKRQAWRSSLATWPHNEPYTVHVLQQMFETSDGRKWRDVPVEEETP